MVGPVGLGSLTQIDTTRHRIALMVERGADPGAVAGTPSPGGLWMPFQASPPLYELLKRRYTAEDAPSDSDSAAPASLTYYFDFLSRSVSLTLPGGSVLAPMPPTEASGRALVRENLAWVGGTLGGATICTCVRVCV